MPTIRAETSALGSKRNYVLAIMDSTELVIDPANTTEPRRPGSARRTSHIDVIAKGELMMVGGFGLHGAARDVATAADGTANVAAESSLDAQVGPGRVLQSLLTSPLLATADELVGLPVAGGFRAATQQAAATHHAQQTPLHTLLDDMPVASLISGYADLYVRAPDVGRAQTGKPGGGLQADICAGWQSGGTMLSAMDRDGQIPVPVGPPSPALELEGDPLSWHELPPLPIGAMRRRRLIDVAPSGAILHVRAMFRDTHVDGDGTETVLHEYDLMVEVDPTSLDILASTATPRVLPWIECPQAVASAGRLVGHQVGTIRDLVRRDLKGTSTCTHLNDLLRSIDDVAPLARLIAS